jgi:molybdate transport repressor ModE-like protein
MLRIEIDTVWRFHREGSPQTAIVMLGILNEIRKTGKLTSAAGHAGLSYRHVWNLVEQWSDFFGVPLVETQRGKGTKLTAFGEKLVWAGERASRPATGKSGAGTCHRNKTVPASAPAGHPRSCQSRFCRIKTAGVARPRARHRRRSALRQQSEFAAVIGAGRL